MGIRFPLLGTYCAYPMEQRGEGLEEGTLPLLQIYGKEERGFWGRDSSRPQTVVPVHISVCHPPHDSLGGGVRRNLKLGEGAEPPPAVRLGNRFPPNPLLNSSSRIPCGILILTVGTLDGNKFPIVWNAFFLSLGTEKWGSGGIFPVILSLSHAD